MSDEDCERLEVSQLEQVRATLTSNPRFIVLTAGPSSHMNLLSHLICFESDLRVLKSILCDKAYYQA